MSISTSIAAWGIDTTSNEVAKEQIMYKKVEIHLKSIVKDRWGGGGNRSDTTTKRPYLSELILLKENWCLVLTIRAKSIYTCLFTSMVQFKYHFLIFDIWYLVPITISDV